MQFNLIKPVILTFSLRAAQQHYQGERCVYPCGYGVPPGCQLHVQSVLRCYWQRPAHVSAKRNVERKCATLWYVINTLSYIANISIHPQTLPIYLYFEMHCQYIYTLSYIANVSIQCHTLTIQ